MSEMESHPGLEELALFSAEGLDDIDECAVLEHLAVCEECAAMASRLDQLVGSGFNAADHAAALRAEAYDSHPLVVAVRAAAERSGTLAGQLLAWLKGMATLPEMDGLPALSDVALASGSTDKRPRSLTVSCEAQFITFQASTGGELCVYTDDRRASFAVIYDKADPKVVQVEPFERRGSEQVARFAQIGPGRFYVALGPLID